MIENGRFLPIGTVVMLKNGKKKVMINAYGVFATINTDKVYEYGACLYPEGVIDSSYVCAFNHSDIDKIFHLGYTSEEQSKFCNKMDKTFEMHAKKLKDV